MRKILSTMKDGKMELYAIKGDNELSTALTELRKRYGIIFKDTIEAMASGASVYNFSIYSHDDEKYKILNYNILSRKDTTPSAKSMYTNFGPGPNAWDMMSKEEQNLRSCRVGGPSLANVEVEVEQVSKVYNILYDEFFRYKGTIVDFTDVIKLINHFDKKNIKMDFDKTIATKKESEKRVQQAFLCEEDIEKMIERNYRELYNFDIELTPREQDCKNTSELFNDVFEKVKLIKLGTYNKYEIEGNTLKILEAYAKRNSNVNDLIDKMEVIGVGSLSREDEGYIRRLYDLDGQKKLDKIHDELDRRIEDEKARDFLKSLTKRK